MNRKLKVNEIVRYIPFADHNITTWKNVLWAFWCTGTHSPSVSEKRLLWYVKSHTKGAQGFIDYCVRHGYLLEVKS